MILIFYSVHTDCSQTWAPQAPKKSQYIHARIQEKIVVNSPSQQLVGPNRETLLLPRGHSTRLAHLLANEEPKNYSSTKIIQKVDIDLVLDQFTLQEDVGLVSGRNSGTLMLCVALEYHLFSIF